MTQMTREMLEEQAEDHVAYKHYLATWDARLNGRMDSLKAISGDQTISPVIL